MNIFYLTKIISSYCTLYIKHIREGTAELSNLAPIKEKIIETIKLLVKFKRSCENRSLYNYYSDIFRGGALIDMLILSDDYEFISEVARHLFKISDNISNSHLSQNENLTISF